MYSGPITIYERNGWKLESYGRGAAYTLWHGNASVFFQGDDATALREAITGPDGFLLEGRFADYMA